jgi:arsenate reductase-like glutaredoxin family protein
MTCPNATFLFSRLNIKREGRHFDTNEVSEAELQALLNTLTEDDFQDKSKKNGRRIRNNAYVRKETVLMVMVANRPKASF